MEIYPFKINKNMNNVRKNKCCIGIHISIITVIQIQIQAVRTSLYLSAVNPWRHERGETQIFKAYAKAYYSDPTRNARRILWCLRSQFLSAGRDPKNSTTIFNGRPQLTVFFQNPQILRTIFSRHDVTHSPALFPFWGLFMT